MEQSGEQWKISLKYCRATKLECWIIPHIGINCAFVILSFSLEKWLNKKIFLSKLSSKQSHFSCDEQWQKNVIYDCIQYNTFAHLKNDTFFRYFGNETIIHDTLILFKFLNFVPHFWNITFWYFGNSQGIPKTTVN